MCVCSNLFRRRAKVISEPSLSRLVAKLNRVIRQPQRSTEVAYETPHGRSVYTCCMREHFDWNEWRKVRKSAADRVDLRSHDIWSPVFHVCNRSGELSTDLFIDGSAERA